MRTDVLILFTLGMLLNMIPGLRSQDVDRSLEVSPVINGGIITGVSMSMSPPIYDSCKLGITYNSMDTSVGIDIGSHRLDITNLDGTGVSTFAYHPMEDSFKVGMAYKLDEQYLGMRIGLRELRLEHLAGQQTGMHLYPVEYDSCKLGFTFNQPETSLSMELGTNSLRMTNLGGEGASIQACAPFDDSCKLGINYNLEQGYLGLDIGANELRLNRLPNGAVGQHLYPVQYDSCKLGLTYNVEETSMAVNLGTNYIEMTNLGGEGAGMYARGVCDSCTVGLEFGLDDNSLNIDVGPSQMQVRSDGEEQIMLEFLNSALLEVTSTWDQDSFLCLAIKPNNDMDMPGVAYWNELATDGGKKFIAQIGDASMGTPIRQTYNVFANTVQMSDAEYTFDGDVHVGGSISKSAGSFRIDHPLDPDNKYLYHSFVESPDMMNIYNGNITTDSEGKATVVLPEYFDSLNIEFRYQLTVIGKFAQAIISKKIEGNQFEIMTDKPSVEVSWQVTGIRNDKYARENRIEVEVSKRPAQLTVSGEAGD